jgi:multidrug efflux pump subunit AcrA (membrane-fusion protein)
MGFGAAVGGGLLLAAGLLAGTRPQTVLVDAGPVAERLLARASVVPSAGVVHVFANTAGRIVRVLAREGDRIEAGQVLAELDVAGQPAKLTSPERGVVLLRHAEVGDYALAGANGATQPLFELADPSRTELRVEVEEADAASLVPQLPVVITALGSSTTAQGRVARVSARFERRSIGADDARVRADGMVRVAAVAWSGSAPPWPLGTRAEVIIELRRRHASARVPRAALAVRDGRTVVERPGPLWTREIPVEVVSVDDAYAEIRGLAKGSEVVVPARPGAP